VLRPEQESWPSSIAPAFLQELRSLPEASQKTVLDALLRREELLREEMRLSFEEAKRGQIFGLIVAILFLSCATFLAYLGHDVPATALGITGFVAIVGKFIQGRSK
jgi:hypothetical protein